MRRSLVQDSIVRLGSHHSGSGLPGRAAARLEALDTENMAQHNGAWRCSRCRRQCAKNAEYCPGCGQHWSAVAESYSSQAWDKGWQQERRAWSPRPRTARSPRRTGDGKGKGKQKEAPATKGKAPEPPAGVPDITQLPIPPLPGKPSLPKGSEAASASAPTEDRRMLEQLMEQLSLAGTELPSGLAAMVTQFQAENHRLHGKHLHQLVARQTTARREIAKLEQDTQAFEKAWVDYMMRLSKLIEDQLEERQKHLAAREAALAAWQTQLTEATAQLAAATGARDKTEDEMDAEEEAVDQAIEDEADLRRAKDPEKDPGLPGARRQRKPSRLRPRPSWPRTPQGLDVDSSCRLLSRKKPSHRPSCRALNRLLL